MSNKNLKNYFNYVKDVLGIKHLFFHSNAIKSKKLLIIVSHLDSYSKSETELLEKMIGALKLDPNMYALVDEKNKDAISGEYILKLTETVPVSQIEKNITTYSPRLLLVEPNLKKKVWDDMQSLLQSMKE